MSNKSDKRSTSGLGSDLDALASRVCDLNRRAERAYTPIVEDLIRSHCSDCRRIEQTLDGLLDFCGHPPILTLYRRLCRHYWNLNPEATARYIRFYREMWDSQEEGG